MFQLPDKHSWTLTKFCLWQDCRLQQRLLSELLCFVEWANLDLLSLRSPHREEKFHRSKDKKNGKRGPASLRWGPRLQRVSQCDKPGAGIFLYLQRYLRLWHLSLVHDLPKRSPILQGFQTIQSIKTQLWALRHIKRHERSQPVHLPSWRPLRLFTMYRKPLKINQ